MSPAVFAPLVDALLANGDDYMHLADLKSYLEADQRLVDLYADTDAWARMTILNIAGSGKFSSDRYDWRVRSLDLESRALSRVVTTRVEGSTPEDRQDQRERRRL